jgi:prepilin-type N-terminal cleavage/methylation domain-containing protein
MYQQEMNETKRATGSNSSSGFSLIECVIALVILAVVALSVGSVLAFSYKNNENAKKRASTLMLAQQRMEAARNTDFATLTAGTVTENNVSFDGLQYNIVTTITATDVITTSQFPGPELKTIVIDVTPTGPSLASDKVTLTTYRGVNRPGPNRVPNPTIP